MPIFLYKKTHKDTGLKYLGKTIATDPYSYPGSGIYWTHHLTTHGYNVETEILRECQTEEELIYWGKYYSKLWNVVESKEWANLTEEAGPGGYWTEESKRKLSQTNKNRLEKLSTEEKIARMKNSCCAPDSYTTKRSKNISKALTGRKLSVEHKKNVGAGGSAYRKTLTQEEKNSKYGGAHSGKTWKLINGKRVWVNKENQNY